MTVRAEGLDIPIQFLKGIGPKRARLFGKLGVETVGQLLFHVPHRYVDRTKTLPIRRLVPGDEVTVFGRVAASGARRTRQFKQLVSCMVRDDTGMVEAVWFNRPDLKDRFQVGQEVMLSGKVTKYRVLQFVNPDFEVADKEGFSGMNTIIPVYPLAEGLSGWTVRRAVQTAMDGFLARIPETLTREMLDHYGFPGAGAALDAMHFPSEVAKAEQARARLIYEELFYLQLVLALRRHRYAEVRKGASLKRTGQLSDAFLSKLDFKFTSAQERVSGEILRDMASERCMNRLLQGDVGSGKTVVALRSMLVAVENKTQAVLMAPTEILATQHFQGWREILTSTGVEVRLLTGSTKKADRREVFEGLRQGTVEVVFGTHALIEEGVEFSRLGLVVVDEQHRFGVMQRSALLSKGLNPDFLVMTATPIPRTLTLTLYGDLDVSILDEKPPGRQPVKTKVVPETGRSKVYGFVEERIAEGEQAFVVCPLIEQSEKLDVASAMETYEAVQTAFANRRIGLVHGRMRSDERAQVMDGFRSGELDILVSTTVIEVGVDIPNATIMLIEHPERFGLAQLHQLRGRIGRGEGQSNCILMVPRVGPGETAERLRFFESNSDGFVLAEKDLELRGPGQLLGTRQHGLPDLRVADPVRDSGWLENARRDAFRIVELDPELASPQNEVVRRTVKARYQGREELLRVG